MSHSSEVVSLKSDEKSINKPVEHNGTGPTSESSSIKCSSVASNQDMVFAKNNPAMMKSVSQNYTEGSEWIT